MKIGILETDQLDQKLRQSFGSYGEQFSKLFHQIDPTLDIEYFDMIEQKYPDKIDQCDAYLITGSKFSAYQTIDWIARLQNYILELNDLKKPLIGICFGHQLIAHTLGGLTEKSSKGWGVGLKTIQIAEQQSWMSNYQNKIALLVSHQDQVVKLPAKANLVASSDFCVYAAFQIEQHILCFQGHPEFTKSYLKVLMEKRKAIIGEKIFKQASDSLSVKNDSVLIAKWLLNFFTEAIK